MGNHNHMAFNHHGQKFWWHKHPHWWIGGYSFADADPSDDSDDDTDTTDTNYTAPTYAYNTPAPYSQPANYTQPQQYQQAPQNQQQAQGPCTCLTKEYLPEGGVLFSDNCTKEQAMATPEELKAQQSQASNPSNYQSN
jgi:hypothetical protein